MFLRSSPPVNCKLGTLSLYTQHKSYQRSCIMADGNGPPEICRNDGWLSPPESLFRYQFFSPCREAATPGSEHPGQVRLHPPRVSLMGTVAAPAVPQQRPTELTPCSVFRELGTLVQKEVRRSKLPIQYALHYVRLRQALGRNRYSLPHAKSLCTEMQAHRNRS